MWKRIIRKLRVMLFHQDQMELQIQEYRKAGIQVGQNCKIYSCLNTGRDASLLSIGNNVTIAGNVTLLMHDNAVIKVSNGNFTDCVGKVEVGDDCFIGNGCIVLPGVKLARGTIVGAGSVVTKSVGKPFQVIAGNPARVIGDWESYREKNGHAFVNLNDVSKETFAQMLERDEIPIICKKMMEKS